MENAYVIAWSSKLRGSYGQGKKLLTREEAERLAEVLNQDYPDFVHEPLNLNSGETEAVPPSNVIDLRPNFSTASASCNSPIPEKEVA